jgi:hypothetical protein
MSSELPRPTREVEVRGDGRLHGNPVYIMWTGQACGMEWSIFDTAVMMTVFVVDIRW